MRYFILIVISVFLIPLSAVKPGIFLGMFSQMAVSDLWYIQYVMMTIMLFTGLSLMIAKENIPLSLFSWFCLFSSMAVTYQAPRSIFVMLQIYLSILAVIYISKLDEKKSIILLKCVVVMAVIQALWTILQYFQKDPIFTYVGALTVDDLSHSTVKLNDTVGLSGSRNQLGIYLSDTLPLVLNYIPWFLPFSLFALFCSTTSASFVGGCSACLFHLFFNKKKWFVPALGFILIAGIIFYLKFETVNDIIISERLVLWKETIKAVNIGDLYLNVNNMNRHINCNPWFGYGLGSFLMYSPFSQTYMVHNHLYEHAHNDYIQAFFELGRIGFVLLLIILADLLIKFIKAKKTWLLILVSACLLSHFINALNIYTVQTAVSGFLLILFLGLFYGEVRRNGELAKVT